jgi:hypothetical protein
MIKRRVKHTPAVEQVDIVELMSRFPVTGRDRAWNARPVISRAYGAAHRIFDKHFKGRLKIEKADPHA